MAVPVLHLLTVFMVVIGVFSKSASASDLLNCVNSKYIQPNIPLKELPNPADKGTHKYKVITYGAQPFFFNISKPDLISPKVRLPSFLTDYSISQGYNHHAYHQFNSKSLPLEAKVWLPLDKSPLPLVLLTHGNSDPGFDYLGELLASRGHAVVQVDQTYLNGLSGENGARGWILLEHLKLLKKWDAEQEHSFFRKFDLNNIALIGMSRGGEAVALATSFNQWDKLPNNEDKLDFNFGIKSVVALAPMDGQYQHVDGRNILRNVNYLVLQGGHDADVYQFLGSQQFNRTKLDNDKDLFKQSIYIYRGNHINFNQDMSDSFHWGSKKDFYSNLLTPSQQEHLTKVFVSAFLEATLSGKAEYKKILKNPLAHQFGLPKDIYVSRHISSKLNIIENFENIPNKNNTIETMSHTLSIQNKVSLETEKLRNGTKTDNHVLKVELAKDVDTRLSLKWLKPQLLLNKHSNKFTLNFSIAQSGSQKHEACNPVNLFSGARLKLFDKSSLIFKRSLNNIGSLAPLLLSDYSALETRKVTYAPTEPVLQNFTVVIDLDKPINTESELEFVLIFKPKETTSIILDDIGISNTL